MNSDPSMATNEPANIISSNLDRRHLLSLIGLGAAGIAVVPLSPASAAAKPTKPSATKPGKNKSTTPTTTVKPAGNTATTLGKKPVRKVKLGFIALTDAAPIIMAKELGYFAERSLDVEVLKQASWPALRDALLNNQIDAAHCLFSMPFSVATGIGGNKSKDLKVAMVLNQNGQGITLQKDIDEVPYGDLAAAKKWLDGKSNPAMGMTFPGGTHDIWLRYWLAATKTDVSQIKISPIPPPQMVQNMTVGNVQAYCVGEPWNAVAVQRNVGFTYLATQDIWQNHSEKALVVGAKFQKETDALSDVMGAILKASKWLDDLNNRSKAADTLSAEKYVNAPADDIRGRLVGKYELGQGLGSKDFAGDQMQFFRGGNVSMPRRGHAVWFMAQYQRLGLLKEAPPFQALADELIMTDLYAKVAAAEGVAVPADDMAAFDVKLDKVNFDPKKPQAEASRP
jgi:nitrate/nitrite transport system substrate-binding protein